ncbi:hypothetical protein HMI01_00390 [Halolactibacillus miurensis]|uniref:DHHW protein n=1 Tax=Halolactibacillus miurensis TaxID=306541 RepID=A0A1I6P8Q5_9BACI|nr:MULTISPECIES: DHHW family protein [Halolactibacillus]GEM03051.1 hypothetical protein HMI01_00390 [Halolactibacillus miurensis]SFS36520.1 DHHW protein [Halolactibacillus miurensis]
MRRLIGMLMIGFFGMLAVLTFIMKDQTFSETENRYLQTMPAIELEAILDGSFMDDIETYLADQIAGKDVFLTLKSKTEQALLKRENNGVVKAGDYLIEPFIYQEDNLLKNLEAINQFHQSNQALFDMTVMIVPNQVAIYEADLPAYLPTDDQAHVLQTIDERLDMDTVNVSEVLRQYKEDTIYYHTDHHWTMRGAYLAYQRWFNEKAKPLSDYQSEVVSTDFPGTRYRKFHDLTLPKDTIEWFNVTDALDLTITYSDGRVTDHYTHPQYLDKTDQYRFFLDGNDSLIKIEVNHEEKTNRKLMVVKDSYADSFIPFLLPHYDEIHLIDPRYYKQSLKAYMKEYELSELLVLYNLHTFNEDQSLRHILY